MSSSIRPYFPALSIADGRLGQRGINQVPPALVLVSFEGHGRSQVQSFPRKRESTPQPIGNAPPRDWIPAFAGMTGVSKGIRGWRIHAVFEHVCATCV